MKEKPVRLNKQEDELERLKDFLKSDIIIKVKFYILLTIAMIIFLALCYLSKGQTYGYL